MRTTAFILHSRRAIAASLLTVTAIFGSAVFTPDTIQIPVAAAAEVADPSYQIKFKLKDSVVDSAEIPTTTTQKTLGLGNQNRHESLAYFEGTTLSLVDAGWTVRLRLKAGSPDFDLTYKFRQTMEDNSLSKTTVDNALSKAKLSNFDASDTNYEAQVNTSFATSTLDFSNKKTADCIPYGCIFPDERTAVNFITAGLPGKLTNMVGTPELYMSAVATQRSWPAEIDGISCTLEVTELNGSYWVEITETDGSRSDTQNKRDRILNKLSQAQLLVTEDAFKTPFIIAGGF